MANLKQQVIKGLTWTGGSQVGRQIAQLVITAILARLLSPNDFGLLGMATVFTGFMGIISEMGISNALIQNQDVDINHLSSAFWFNVGASIILCIFLIIISPLIAIFYNQPGLQPILVVLSIGFILAAFSIIQQTILRKEMNFKVIAVVDLTATLVSGITGILMALRGYGVWSLVVQSLVHQMTTSLLFWLLSSWRPRFFISRKCLQDFIEFSLYLTGFNIINYFNRNIDYLLIGKFLGVEALGFYTLAYKIMIYPLRNISWVISKVIFPAFSKIQNDLARLRNSYLKIIKGISLVSFPMMTMIFIIAPEFIVIIFGRKWEPVIPIIRIFCLCGAVQSINTTIGNVILSQGKAKLHLQLGLLSFILIAFSIVVGLKWGVIGVASWYTFVYVIWSIFTQNLVNKMIALDNHRFLKNLKNGAAISLGIALVVMISSVFLKHYLMARFVILLALSTILYITFLFSCHELQLVNRRLIVSIKEE